MGQRLFSAGLGNWLAITLLALTLGVPTPAAAQTTNGVISGIVSDAQGAVLPGVTLTLRNTETGLTRTLVTEIDGLYRAGGLPPGPYSIRGELQGFGTVEVTDVTVAVGTEAVRNLTMQVQGVQESVTVTAQAPVVNTTMTEVAGVITQEQMQMLPLPSRQPMSLALLMPGTNADAVRPRKANANIGAGAFTMGSALLVDGVWNKEGNTGEPRQDFPQAAIREFKVFVSQSPAEYGWTAGGVVSFATKSGTNLFTGEVFEYFRDKTLNAMTKFEKESGAPKPDYRRHQFGMALGGPIVQDRLHFFTAAEGTRETKFFTVNTGRPDLYGKLEGTFEEPEYNAMVFGRGDMQINQAQTLFARYAWQNSDFSCELCGGRNADISDSGIQQKRYSLLPSHTWVVSSRILNEVRGQWTNYHFRQHPPGVAPQEKLYDDSSARTAPLTQVYNFPSLSWGSNANFYTTHRSREIRDDLTISLGRHTWKAGGDFQSLSFEGDNRPAIGTWTFRTDQPFDPTNLAAFVPAPGSVQQFTANLLKLPRYSPNAMWSVYGQDEWRPVSNLTLTLGLRYDRQIRVFNETLDFNNPKDFPTTGTNLELPFVDLDSRGDKNNWGPRAGLAWDLNEGRSVVRAGYGIYYNPNNIQIAGQEVNSLQQASVVIANPSYPDPYGGLDPLRFVSTAPQNITILANDLENLESHAYTVGLSQELWPSVAIHVDGVYTRMTKVPTAVDINRRAGDVPTAPRARPQFQRINQIQSIGEVDYKALLVRLEKRFDQRYMYGFSYTLAESSGNLPGGATTFTVTQAELPDLDEGPSSSDRRHAIAASGSVLLPADITLSGVFSYRSTMPFSATAGVDLNADANITDYVPGTTRSAFNRGDNESMMALVNAWRISRGLAALPASQIDTNEFATLDVRVSKSFQIRGRQSLELMAQVFNLLGRDNLQPTWSTNALSNAFGRIQQALNRQQAELVVRFAF
jgi:Carboxypeptidase regulatory-like domain/TonB dependent receptor-like, beta-barrel